MKIGIFSSYFSPHLGGVESYVSSLGHHLKKAGFAPVIIACNTNNCPTKEKKDFEIIRLDCWHWFGGTFPVPKLNQKNREILKNFFDSKPSLIITQTRFFPLSFWASFLAKKINVRHIHVEHGSAHVTKKNPILTLLFHLYDHLIGGYVVKKAATNIVIARPGARLVKHLGGKKIIYIPNSIDVDKYPTKEQKKEKKITFVGRLIEEKGVQDLIEAFNRVELKDWELIIIGKGRFGKSLRKLAQNNPRIVFTGQLKEKEVMRNLKDSAILINPSYLEGLPTAVLEGIASGTAVIATRAGGTPDIIKDGFSGFLYNPRDVKYLAERIKLLAESEKLRKRLANNAKKILPNFSWEKNITKIISVLR